MSKMADYDIEVRENGRLPRGADLAEVAPALGGEVYGGAVLCPSPGYPPGDRSCEVHFSRDCGSFHVYACEGSKGAAIAMVWRALGRTPPPGASRADAERLWAETAAAEGSVVEHYLRRRGITLPVPSCLRFHGKLRHAESRGDWPAMVAQRVNSCGWPAAVHRTYLTLGGHWKAPVTPARKDLGPCKGTAIRLAPVAPELAVGEGIETSLSFMQVSGLPTWAAGSAKAMELMILPPEVRRVNIAADGDPPGRRAAEVAAARWMREGRMVRIYRAPDGLDFNDLLLREAASCAQS